MVWDASNRDTSFVIPPENVAAALAAINSDPELNNPGAPYMTLTDAIEDRTNFLDTEEDAEGLLLGSQSESYLSTTEPMLKVLARFAVEGSVVRLEGQDGTLFGFRVVGAALRQESADVVWSVTPPTLSDFVEAYEAYAGDSLGQFVHVWERFILTGKDLRYHCAAATDGTHEIGAGECVRCHAPAARCR